MQRVSNGGRLVAIFIPECEYEVCVSTCGEPNKSQAPLQCTGTGAVLWSSLSCCDWGFANFAA